MPVTLIVYNKHNVLSSNFTLHLLYPINGISIVETNVTSEANVPVSLQMLFADRIDEPMGEVNYTVKWGESEDPTSTLNIVARGSMDLPHTYGVQGNYSIIVMLTTVAETQVFTIPAYIWDRLNVKMTISSLVGKIGDEFIVSFTDPPFEGFQYNINYGQGVLSNPPSDLYLNYTEPDPAVLTFSYSALGTYNVSLKAFNPVYQIEIYETVIIEHPLTVDTFTVTPALIVIPIPDGIISMSASVIEGIVGNVDCYWDFDVVNGITENSFNIESDFPVQETFTYRQPGTYLVDFHCNNSISNMTVTSTVTVRQWDISDFDVVVKNPQVMSGMIPVSDTLISITLLDCSRPPYNTTASFNFGDNSSSEISVIDQWETYHRYPRRDIYACDVTLVHPEKGNITLNFEVRQGAFQISLDAVGGLVITQTFQFTVEVPGPFRGAFTINFGDSETTDPRFVSVSESTKLFILHTYGDVDDFQASLHGASTVVGNEYLEDIDFEGPIRIDGSVADLALTLSPRTILYPPGDIKATVKLDRNEHKLRWIDCTIDFNEVLNPALQVWNGTLLPGDSFSVDFQYMTLGSKSVSVMCSNDFSRDIVITEALTYNPCFSDDAIFDRQYGVIDSPLFVLNSVKFRLVTRTVIKCSTTVPNFHWWLYQYTASGEYLGERTDLVQPNTDFIEFQPGTLEPGIYKLKLNISFGAEYDYIWLEESTFVRVVRVPLVADILGGAFRLTGKFVTN